MYQPYQYQQPYQQPWQRSRDLQFVNGIESARMYQVEPNSKTILMDRDKPRFYLVEADAAGQRRVEAYDFQAAEEPKPEFAGMEELENLRSAYESIAERVEAINARLEELHASHEPNGGEEAGRGAVEQRPAHARGARQAV